MKNNKSKKYHICFDGGMDYYMESPIKYNTEEEAQKALNELEAMNEKILGEKMGYYIERF